MATIVHGEWGDGLDLKRALRVLWDHLRHKGFGFLAYGSIPADRAKANARLVACAPDLLKELARQCDNIAFILNRVDLHGFHEKFETELVEARAAISKAEGRTP